jgi:hypothetical protein
MYKKNDYIDNKYMHCWNISNGFIILGIGPNGYTNATTCILLCIQMPGNI